MRIDESSAGERQEKRLVSLTINLLAAYRYDEFRVTDDGLREHEIEWAGSSPVAAG